MREIIRAVAIAALVFLMATDVKEILTELSNSATMKPFLEWINPHAGVGGGKGYRAKRRIHSISPVEETFQDVEEPLPLSSSRFLTEGTSTPTFHVNGEEEEEVQEGMMTPQRFKANKFNPESSLSQNHDNNNPLQDPALEAVRRKLQAAGYTSVATGQPADQSGFDDQEREQILALKTHITNVMQQWCLPKLVCELHASMSDRSTLTEAERSLLSLIRETSLGTMGEVVSRYHFAAHMGQLLSGVDGNGCYNLYPNCPLSGNKVLQMVKRVRIR